MENFKKIITHNWKLKLFSLFIGVIIWGYILNLKGRTAPYFQNILIAKNIPVFVKNQNSYGFLFSPPTVNVYFVREKKSIFIRPRVFKIYVNTENLAAGEKKSIPVEVEEKKGIVIIKVVPDKILVIRRKN